ncbi:uncharacterized protein LOC133172000 isoform X1 [Saccostrea echinata]|uniref:uncharacterized protein LOC133172000 isoform X1 n=1 Tax=Saccostrea echinata TaxID=191078 RepID=UPI002A7FA186|nr:uncharacterized protein LOC133172000 isoform X1 [Saccostrea echinata]
MQSMSVEGDVGICISFETQYKTDAHDKCLAVCGSLAAIGNWDVKKAVIADEKPENSGKWIVSVHLPANVKFEWKWVVVWRNTRIAFRWEERQNRVTEVGESGFMCIAYWNCDPIYEPLPESLSDTWTVEDDKRLEKLAGEEALEDTQSRKSVIASYIRDLGYLISWSLQSIKTKVMSFFHGVGGLFRRGSAHDHSD